MNLSSSLPAINSSIAANETGLTSKVYVFLPIQPSTRRALLISLVSVGVVGFLGNILAFWFFKTKDKSNSSMKNNVFVKNLNLYLKSLAISDVLCDAISLPPICVQLYYDVFSTGWGCRKVRYINYVFPSVTMNNLLFISIEKYLSTREVPRTLSHSTVKKVVGFAWFAAMALVLLPNAAFKGVRFDLNETHYTVVCKYDNQYLPYRVISISFITLQYVIPSCIMIRVHISLVITLWKRFKTGVVDVQRDNAIKMMQRAIIVRGTFVCVLLTFAFILPYIFFFGQIIYYMVTKVSFDFETDYVMRCVGAILGYSNSVVNVIIYILTMKDFRAFLKKKFTPRFLSGD